MIELAKHIEILLLENDCVIVPELGGFITHHQPAHYEEDEGVYLPPMRTVAFNPQLTMNDGLLAQSYMQAYHIDYSDAVRKIAEVTESMKEVLHKEGMIDMQGIGRLHYTIYGTYDFHPSENGVLSPALYALDAFSITPLALMPVAEEQVVIPQEQPIEITAKEKKEIRLNPKWWSNAVAVAVAAVLFFVLSVPVENTYIETGNYASLGTDCLFDAIRSQSVATTLKTPEKDIEQPQVSTKNGVVPVVVKVEKVATPAVRVTKPDVEKKTTEEIKVVPEQRVEKPRKAVSKPESKPVPQKVTAVPKKKYHLIVASLTTDQDAQRMLQEFRKQGHADAKVLGGNGRFRISLYSYAEQAAAYQKLNELKQQEAFKQAWMLTSKQ